MLTLTSPHNTLLGPDFKHPRRLLRAHPKWHLYLLDPTAGMRKMGRLKLVIVGKMPIGRQLKGVFERGRGVEFVMGV